MATLTLPLFPPKGGESFAALPDGLYLALIHPGRDNSTDRGPLIGPLTFCRVSAGSPTASMYFRFVGNRAEQWELARRYGFDHEGEHPWDGWSPHAIDWYQGRYNYQQQYDGTGPSEEYNGYVLLILTAGQYPDVE
jgi:hypothetical protein